MGTLTTTIYDLHSTEEKLAFIDPVKSGHYATRHDDTARNTIALVEVLADTTLDEEARAEVARLVEVIADTEKATFAELTDRMLYTDGLTEAGRAAREKFEAILAIGMP